MKHLLSKVTSVALVIAVLCLLLAAQASAKERGHQANSKLLAQAQGSTNPPTDQIIIKYKISANLNTQAAAERPNQMERLSQTAGISLDYFRPMSGDAHVLKLPQKLPEPQANVYAARLATLPEVEYAEADSVQQAIETIPSDPSYAADQWNMQGGFGIHANDAWDVTHGNIGIVVAVVDTGVLWGHPDLASRVVQGYDFISDPVRANDGDGRDADPDDPGDWTTTNGQCGKDKNGNPIPAEDSSWHGTHVAGIIGADTNNGQFVAGVDWRARILPVRVLGVCGGNTSDIVDGMRWAAGLNVPGVPANPNPARVLNLSLGATGTCSSSYRDAIRDVRAQNAVVVVSAGNDNVNVDTQSPANCLDVIRVASTDSSGNKSSFSNFGQHIIISAPGSAILSTVDKGKTIQNQPFAGYKSGTSMAAPHVSGAISLLLGLRPELDPNEVLDVIEQHPTLFPSGSACNTTNCGDGILNVDNVVRDLYVDLSFAGPNANGRRFAPYDNMSDAYDRAWDGARLIIAPGTYISPSILDKHITIASSGGTVILTK